MGVPHGHVILARIIDQAAYHQDVSTKGHFCLLYLLLASEPGKVRGGKQLLANIVPSWHLSSQEYHKKTIGSQ
jgi:hypothetical protein